MTNIPRHLRRDSGVIDSLAASALPIPANPSVLYDSLSLSGSDGTSIGTWSDTSGNANDATAFTPNPILKKGVNGVNSMAVLRGVPNGYMKSASSFTAGLTSYTLALVVRPLTSASTMGIYQHSSVVSDTVPDIYVRRISTNVEFYTGTAGYFGAIAHANNVAQYYILTSSVANASKIYSSGGNILTNSSTPQSISSGAKHWLFNGYAGFFDGDVAEFIAWPREITSSEVTSLITYLKNTFGLS